MQTVSLDGDGFQFADAKHREQPLPPTAVVGLKSEAGAAKNRSPAANIDRDRALISFKEMPIPSGVDANHEAGDIASREIGGLAVQRAALVNNSERLQNPALLDMVEFGGFIWEPYRNRRHNVSFLSFSGICDGTLVSDQFRSELRCSPREPTTSNQSMKPTAPLRKSFSVFATTPTRGLSLSR